MDARSTSFLQEQPRSLIFSSKLSQKAMSIGKMFMAVSTVTDDTHCA